MKIKHLLVIFSLLAAAPGGRVLLATEDQKTELETTEGTNKKKDKTEGESKEKKQNQNQEETENKKEKTPKQEKIEEEDKKETKGEIEENKKENKEDQGENKEEKEKEKETEKSENKKEIEEENKDKVKPEEQKQEEEKDKEEIRKEKKGRFRLFSKKKKSKKGKLVRSKSLPDLRKAKKGGPTKKGIASELKRAFKVKNVSTALQKLDLEVDKPDSVKGYLKNIDEQRLFSVAEKLFIQKYKALPEKDANNEGKLEQIFAGAITEALNNLGFDETLDIYSTLMDVRLPEESADHISSGDMTASRRKRRAERYKQRLSNIKKRIKQYRGESKLIKQKKRETESLLNKYIGSVAALYAVALLPAVDAKLRKNNPKAIFTAAHTSLRQNVRAALARKEGEGTRYKQIYNIQELFKRTPELEDVFSALLSDTFVTIKSETVVMEKELRDKLGKEKLTGLLELTKYTINPGYIDFTAMDTIAGLKFFSPKEYDAELKKDILAASCAVAIGREEAEALFSKEEENKKNEKGDKENTHTGPYLLFPFRVVREMFGGTNNANTSFNSVLAMSGVGFNRLGIAPAESIRLYGEAIISVLATLAAGSGVDSLGDFAYLSLASVIAHAVYLSVFLGDGEELDILLHDTEISKETSKADKILKKISNEIFALDKTARELGISNLNTKLLKDATIRILLFKMTYTAFVPFTLPQTNMPGKDIIDPKRWRHRIATALSVADAGLASGEASMIALYGATSGYGITSAALFSAFATGGIIGTVAAGGGLWLYRKWKKHSRDKQSGWIARALKKVSKELSSQASLLLGSDNIGTEVQWLLNIATDFVSIYALLSYSYIVKLENLEFKFVSWPELRHASGSVIYPFLKRLHNLGVYSGT